MLLDVVRDCQQVAWVACDGLAECVDFEDIVQVFLRVAMLDQVEHVLQVSQRERLEVTEKHSVVVVVEDVAEAQRVQRQLLCLFAFVLVAWYHLVIPVVIRLAQK